MSTLSRLHDSREEKSHVVSVMVTSEPTPLQSMTPALTPARQTGSTWNSPLEHALDSSTESILRAFASSPVHLTLDHLQVDHEGLSAEEADSRLRVKGPNTLHSQKAPNWFILLLKVIPNPFNILLVVLAILNAAIPPPQWVSEVTFSRILIITPLTMSYQKGFIVLMVMVIVSALVRFWQEYRSNMAVFRLQMSIKESARVRRRAVETHISTSELVPGDIVTLHPGDVVPADCLVLSGSFLRISQSQWTGESVPVSKMASSTGNKTEGSLFDLSNLCFMGTGVVSGNATVLVLRTGNGKKNGTNDLSAYT